MKFAVWILALSIVACWTAPAEAAVADLVVTQVMLPTTTVVAGTSKTATVVVKNRGTAASVTSYTRVYLSRDSVRNSPDTTLATVPTAALRAGQSTTLRAGVKFSADAAAGTVYLFACADATSRVRESSNTNNCRRSTAIRLQRDSDADGTADPLDCAPTNPAINPGASDAPEMTFTDSNCDGIDGTAAASIFVSPDGNDDNPGTRALPKLTVHQATLAGLQHTPAWPVLVAAGTYHGFSAYNSAGVHVHGGYDPATWSRSANAVTVLTSMNSLSSTGVLVELVTFNGFRDYWISNVVVEVRLSTVTLRNVKINAVSAASGRGGGSGSGGSAGGDGTNGGTGACDNSNFHAWGGGGGSSPVGNTGGAGGDGGYNYLYQGGYGRYGANGVGTFRGDGGTPGANGNPGRAGTNGWSGGAGATGSAGRLGFAGGFEGTWITEDGTDGTAGTSGSGGGGGGGGGMQTGALVTDGSGNAGGGGGGGGSAGAGGRGGTQGGSSIGITINQSTVALENSSIQTSNAGNGGAGGAGGYGGAGGVPGAGGTYCTGEIGRGGSGGWGGAGGRGGGGGGGGGGASIGVFVREGSTFINTNNSFTVGAAGAGGAGGAPNGPAGNDGIATTVYYDTGT